MSNAEVSRESQKNSARPHTYRVSVRKLVEFICRSGDYIASSDGIPGRLRAMEGTRGHKLVQKSRPVEYVSEVAVSKEFTFPTFLLRVEGRIDGVLEQGESILVEEIKTVGSSWDHVADPIHWAQLKFYAAVLAEDRTKNCFDVQLTYLELESGELTVFREKIERRELVGFASKVVEEYATWIEDLNGWRHRRDSSIEALGFPYKSFREGQRSLATAVYKTVTKESRLFVEAPTGIGKTMSVLFPAIKALPNARQDRIFYLTAKNSTQSVAESALCDLRSAGLKFRSVTICAREKVCARPDCICRTAESPLGKGYFDRVKPAIRAALKTENVTTQEIKHLADQFGLCGHELSLDVSEWVDAVICDYNYAFDPTACLKRHFSENNDRKVLLVDEAHNLVDRAREMFSAELNFEKVFEELASIPKGLNKARQTLKRGHTKLCDVVENQSIPLVVSECPESLSRSLNRFVEQADEWFAKNRGDVPEDGFLDVYFAVLRFLQILDTYDSSYRTIIDGRPNGLRIRLFCVDAAPQLQKRIAEMDSAVFFSATLSPLGYFRTALGGETQDRTLRLNSPFDSSHLKLLVAPHIRTSYRHRDSSYEQVASAIRSFIGAKQGNYLIFFPSFSYLDSVSKYLLGVNGSVEYVAQSPAMNEEVRKSFLQKFEVQTTKTIVGLAVMGGIFGEGVDLVGDRLIGAVVVGVGLPQVCTERELIRSYFDEQGHDGFEYAYTFPGLNRVFQAAGRVIRSETDRGAILLIDSRFTDGRIRGLFPCWWKPQLCKSDVEMSKALGEFWYGQS